MTRRAFVARTDVILRYNSSGPHPEPIYEGSGLNRLHDAHQVKSISSGVRTFCNGFRGDRLLDATINSSFRASSRLLRIHFVIYPSHITTTSATRVGDAVPGFQSRGGDNTGY